MRLGGVEVSNRLAKNIAAVTVATTAVVGLCTSISTAILGLTSFCFGAALFSFVLDVCPNNELPNFMAYLKPPRLHGEPVASPNKNEPWRELAIPKEIDDALAELYERILQEYVYSWYGQISYDEEFLLEIRTALRYATAVIMRRLSKVDLTTLITRRGIPIGLTHLDSYLHAKRYADAFKSPVRDSYYDFVGHYVHPATHSREKEVLYVHDVTRKLLPHLTAKNTLNCLAVKAFLNDLLAGAVLQPVLDILASPDIINYILQVSFNDIPTKVFQDPSGESSELLEAFANVSRQSAASKSALQLDLSAILKNQQALFAFMQFLKGEGAINQLQFCLSIEDFSKRIMNDIGPSELDSLHKEALELYDMYFKANAIHKVAVSVKLVREIDSILSGPPADVVKLRTTAPLFGAYEEVYSKLESMCPAFHKSEQYFTFLLGRRVNDLPDSMDKQESKLWKTIKRLSPFGGGGGGSGKRTKLPCCDICNAAHSSSPNTSSPVPHIQIDLTEADMMGAQLSRAAVVNDILGVVASSDIDMALRSTTSDQQQQDSLLLMKQSSPISAKKRGRMGLKLSKSMANIASRTSSPARKTMSDAAPPVQPKPKGHNSGGGGGGEHLFGAAHSQSHGDLRTLQKQRSVARKLKKSLSVVLRPATPKILRKIQSERKAKKKEEKRSKSDLAAKTTEKIGKGLKTLKQGVMVKSMEGLVDPLDPAYDLADMCQQAEREESMSNCSSDILEFRDLSAWRVSIAEVRTIKTISDSNIKSYFAFVVEVQRIDVAAKTANAEDLHWSRHRRYSEFYNLEAKLTEFHGEFEDAKLPPRAKLFSGKGLDVMQSKKQPFEDYLRCLLQKPSLKGSDILYTFLKSTDEFTAAGTSNLGLGKMIKNVPMKLTKDRGQGLQPFITTFVASTLSGPPKPRYDSVVNSADYDMSTERPILPHPLYQDNLGIQQPSSGGIHLGHCNKYYSGMKETSESGIFDTIVYLAVNVFKISKSRVQMLSCLRILLRNTLDAFVDYAIASKLKSVLSVGRVAWICKLLEEAIFDNNSPPRTDEDKLSRRRLALSNMKGFLRPLIGACVSGEDNNFDRGVDHIFQSLQDPVINKHLAFVLLDAALAELFPELAEAEAGGRK